MKIQCFLRPDFDGNKLISNPVEVTKTIETPWSSGGYPFTIKYLNKDSSLIGFRRNPEGFAYCTCIFDPIEELARNQDVKKHPENYKFRQHLEYFETEEESFQFYINSLKSSLEEQEQKLKAITRNIEAIKKQFNKIL